MCLAGLRVMKDWAPQRVRLISLDYRTNRDLCKKRCVLRQHLPSKTGQPETWFLIRDTANQLRKLAELWRSLMGVSRENKLDAVFSTIETSWVRYFFLLA